MGSSSSKFKKYLLNGDEFAAMQIFQSSPELQRNLNPNLSYGDHHNHDTALHFAARHGMKHLLRTFLIDLGGNPNKKNGNNETSLHSCCKWANTKSLTGIDRRNACVTLILQWRGSHIEPGGREKIELAAQDKDGNTALHLAAGSGLEQSVEALLTAGAPLFTENKDRQTPCDAAVKNKHHDIAQILESKMVFDDSLDVHNEDELSQGLSEVEEVYCGLRAQDLQETKDQLLVETSDMLQVPLFTAEALLRHNEWSRQLLLEQWVRDPVSCCQLAGVEPPPLLQPNSDISPIHKNVVDDDEIICEICLNPMLSFEKPVSIPCQHNFCNSCWEAYLSHKIMEGIHDITCPGYQCHILVPQEVIERIVNADLAKRYQQFDIKAFVESNKSIKWCPIAGCGRAVRLPESENEILINYYNTSHSDRRNTKSYSHAVDCGNGHFFCWECLGDAHAPSNCWEWRQWLEKVTQVQPEQLNNDMKDLEDASNCLWLVSNSKPCPNCNSPIQKNEGCNHIKCSKCKYDFCWVCLEAWKRHSSATGGYFRCSRFPAAVKADEKQGGLISEAVARSQKIKDLNRFLHFYTRFKNHENSREIEETLLNTVQHKMEVLASSLVANKGSLSEKEKKCTKFVEEGVRELLKARRVLCGSYVHGFYLEDNGYNKAIFEFLQNELENCVDKLSEMIARPYLRTPRHVMIEAANITRKKRHELVMGVSKGLAPPDLPPSLNKRTRKLPKILLMDAKDKDNSHDIVSSLKVFDPNNPWIKDTQGIHIISSSYDPQDADSATESDASRTMGVSIQGQCSNQTSNSNRPKPRNTRNRLLPEYCGFRCANPVSVGGHFESVGHDYSMDLMIALEMSRLQMIEDTMKRENVKPNTSVSVIQTDSDFDFNKAIELSLMESNSEAETRNSVVGNLNEAAYRKTQDFTVDHFLKSLAGKDITPNLDNPLFYKDVGKNVADKEMAIFRPHRTEDGRFEISELHDSCYHDDEAEQQNLRRVRSTGDISNKQGNRGFVGEDREDSRFQLDSDHSSQHEEKVEEIAKRILAFPAKNKLKTGVISLEDTSSGSAAGGNMSYSVEDSTTTEADLEVCHILGSQQMVSTGKGRGTYYDVKFDDHLKLMALKKPRKTADDKSPNLKNSNNNNIVNNTRKLCDKSESVKNLIEEVQNTLKSIESKETTEFLRLCPERASTGKIKLTNLESLGRSRYSKNGEYLFVGSDKTLNEAHRKAFKAAGGKIIHKTNTGRLSNTNLRIRIAKSPIVTESSNEFETETGIPKSPTLFISGVSISRTPEPEKKSSIAKNSHSSLNFIPASVENEHFLERIVPPEAFNDLSLPVRVPKVEIKTEKVEVGLKSKSASEPEREREMFRFPKSSTDGALSSVLHVQESNLSSDDFHEVLFLLETSPKHGAKRRKKSKKERDKVKENSEKDNECAEASSAL